LLLIYFPSSYDVRWHCTLDIYIILFWLLLFFCLFTIYHTCTQFFYFFFTLFININWMSFFCDDIKELLSNGKSIKVMLFVCQKKIATISDKKLSFLHFFIIHYTITIHNNKEQQNKLIGKLFEFSFWTQIKKKTCKQFLCLYYTENFQFNLLFT
jgi:hypothetical protein